MMSKKILINQLFLIVLIIVNLSCGTLNKLGPKKLNGKINNLRIINNQLTFTSPDSCFALINYKNRVNNDDHYRGWTAGEGKISHSYYLPVTEKNINYEMRLSLFTPQKVMIKDTTFVFLSSAPHYNFLKVHFIDVQQGDAILVQTPNGKNIQCDGGYGSRGTSTWQGGGATMALNYLLQQDVLSLDYIIETHRDLDHYGGLDDILRSSIQFNQANYISNTTPQGYQTGATLILGEVKINFLNFGLPTDVDNDTSIVLKIDYDQVSILLTGDATGVVQNRLYDLGFDLSADVLKVAHHGAHTSNTTDMVFLNKVFTRFAQIATLSFGKGNPYGHPASLSRFSQYQVYGTNQVNSTPATGVFSFDCGTILVQSDGKMVFVSTER